MNIKYLYALLKNLSSKTFEKGEIVINEGDKINNVFYIRKGLVRSYLINDKGEKITFQLFAEKQLFGNVHTILFNEFSKFTFETLEKTKVYFADVKTFQDLSNSNSGFLKIDNGILFLPKFFNMHYSMNEADFKVKARRKSTERSIR